MSDSDRSPEEMKQKQKSDDEACGRLLEVYVQEAKQYDEGLVKSWKEDMDVTLVFSGLYSAVLTAFVIESYQKLQEDPADASVVLLRQLVSISNSSDIVSAPACLDDEFTPTPAAVACNILWFSSLILALCCAFLATFVQQWSRQFLHKTGLLRSSTAHARLFSFLYFGLKNFQMHSVVNVIPSMLHLSLFLFLGGLIAFLRDVSPVLTYIVGVALAVVLAVYTGFTIWPLIALNSPYQTPLSPIAWKLWQLFTHYTLPSAKSALKKFKSLVPHAVIQAFHFAVLPIHSIGDFLQRAPSIWTQFMILVKTWVVGLRSFLGSSRTSIPAASAVSNSLSILPTHQFRMTQVSMGDTESDAGDTVSSPPECSLRPEKLPDLSDAVLSASQNPDPKRDVQSIIWTLSSLTNDEELLLFVEALPYAIYGPDGIHDNNLHLIKPLVETPDPESDIIHRITSLMTNASNSWFDDKYRTRCSIACPKALWALAFMFAEQRGQFDLAKASREFWFPKDLLQALYNASQSATGDTPGRKCAISAWVLCAFEYEITSSPAGVAISQFLEASGELEPVEFERTCQSLSRHLSRETASDDMFWASDLWRFLKVPQIDNKDPPSPGQIARLDVVVGLCLQLPKLNGGDARMVLQYIYQRAEMNGWGSTKRIWDDCESPRALGACDVGRDFCNAMREYFYTLSLSFSTAYRNHNTEPLLLACVCKLTEHSGNANDENIDTSQITLETMIAMKVVLIDAPEDEAEVSEDFEVVRQYVKQNVLRLEERSWTWDDPRYGEDVKAGRVVVLTTRLLQRFMLSVDDPVATNDILDALEFILYVSDRCDLFLWALHAVSEDVLAIFSKVTLGICQRWTEKPSEALSRNALDTIFWMWRVWGSFELPQSEEATRNLSKSAKLMVSPESLAKVEECKSKEAIRVPAPHKGIADYLSPFFDRRFDFKEVLERYKGLQSDDQPIDCQALTAPSDISSHPGDSAIVEESPGINEDGDGLDSLSSSIPQGPISLPLPNDLWVI